MCVSLGRKGRGQRQVRRAFTEDRVARAAEEEEEKGLKACGWVGR